MPATASKSSTTVPHSQQVALALKKVIESIYTDGITAILKTSKAADGTVTGRFADGTQIYDFSVSPKNELAYNEVESTGGRSDSYLIGYTLDSGMALSGQRLDIAAPSARAAKCVKGKRCGEGCIERGLQCRQGLPPEAVQTMNSVRSAMPQVGVAQPAANPQQAPVAQQSKPVQSNTSPQASPAKITDPKLISPDKNPALDRKLAAFGLTSTAAVGALAVSAAVVVRDLKQSEVDFDSIRMPPGGVPDAETMKVYDSFKPGDLIRKNFKGADGGGRSHYSVYVGRDPETGEHQMIEVTGKDSVQGLDVGVYKSPLIGKPNPQNTQYEKVPEKEMYRDGTKKISPEETVKRAEAMVGKKFTYKGFESNCESFARGVVEGKSYSTQGDRISGFTNAISSFVTHTGLKVRANKSGVGLSGYAKDKTRMTAQEMLDFVDRERTKDAIKDSRKDAVDPIASLGMPDPDDYAHGVEVIADQFPAMANPVRVEMYKKYMLALLAASSTGGTDDSKEPEKRGDKACGKGFIPNRNKCNVGLKRSPSERPGAISRPSSFSAKDKQLLLAAGLTTTGALAIAGTAGAVTVGDIHKSATDFHSIRVPPNGVPDAETLDVYDTFQPGDLIRKNFLIPGTGGKALAHYSVYTGKDPRTGKHMMINMTGEKLENGRRVGVYEAPLDILAQPNNTQYEKVPAKEMYRDGTRKISREEVVQRAKALVGKPATYKGFDSNCESLARGIVEGRAYSTQGDRASRFTRAVSNFITDTGLKVASKNYAKEKNRLTAQQLIDTLDKQLESPTASRKDSQNLIADMGLPDARDYAKSVEVLADQFPGMADAIRVEMYKKYLMLLLSSSELDSGKKEDRQDKACGGGYIANNKKCTIGLARPGRETAEDGDTKGLFAPAQIGAFAAVGLTGVAATVIAGAAVATVTNDLKKAGSATAFDSIRQPPKGVPDAETLKVYDTFQPGDVIRKNFKAPVGSWQHYSVYTGKDLETGEHMMIDVSHQEKDGAIDMRVRKRSLISDASPESTQFEKVPEKELHPDGAKPYSQEEILARAHSLVDKTFSYRGFTSNCESFARGIVTGKAKATQRERITAFGNAVSVLTTEAALRVKKEGKKIKVSPYHGDKTRMTASQMMEWLDKQKRKDSIDDLQRLPLPEVYASAAEVLAQQFPAIADSIRIEMYKMYFMAMLTQINAAEAPQSTTPP